MRNARATTLLIVAICVTGCAGGKDATHSSSASGSSSSSTTAVGSPAPIVKVHIPGDGQLRRVVSEWTRRNQVAGAVVGVQIGNRAPIFVTDGNAPTRPAALPRELVAYSDASIRAHVRGDNDLTRSFFKIGPNGKGASAGIQGVSNDGFCALSPDGCPPGAHFFAVGAFRPVAGGSAVIVYDPVYDISVVVVGKCTRAGAGDLALRADLLTKLGAAGYDKAVRNTARTVPSTPAP